MSIPHKAAGLSQRTVCSSDLIGRAQIAACGSGYGRLGGVARRGCARLVETTQDACGLMKIGETEMSVGFEIGTFRPFVPGVDKDNLLRGLKLPQRALTGVR